MALYVNGKVSTRYAVLGLGYGWEGYEKSFWANPSPETLPQARDRLPVYVIGHVLFHLTHRGL